ncbi:ATP-binding protein [Nocardiopsis halotolerans]|uniref:ATP-binding protein n=1 Tax=Nocardiopsis halotolerans TaxID=124252 RepID=UPI0003480CF5|nr:ATP-binding protein [Nocardiopsis halotolerans]
MNEVMCVWRRPGPEDVGLARFLVDGALTAAEVDEAGLGVARLAVSEAFTNALLHGRPEVGVEVWTRPGRCGVVEVYDTGPVLPVFPEPEELTRVIDDHGRGLGLIRAFTREVCGVYRCGVGKRVWFAVAMDGSALDTRRTRALVEEHARMRAPRSAALMV